ncbi:hypothetical protein KPL74_05285 [Bacillus sp. NP157]|nr:hypothetical protein KPL74_05285 [Bacillus sp. NP157]
MTPAARRFQRIVAYGVFACIGLAPHGAAHASGGSYAVDDASVVGAGQCQVESWLRAWSKGSDGVHSVPACGIGPLEFGLDLETGQRVRGIGASPAVKWQLRDGDDKGVGVALVANVSYSSGRQRDAQSYVATTFGLDDARRWMVALNAGTDRTRGETTHALYGVGLSYALTQRWAWLVERLWTHRAIADQTGVRLAFGDSSLDLVFGRERSLQRSHWINIGWNASF